MRGKSHEVYHYALTTISPQNTKSLKSETQDCFVSLRSGKEVAAGDIAARFLYAFSQHVSFTLEYHTL